MSKKARKLHRKLANSLVSFIVLAIVILPLALSVRWAKSLWGNHDPRKAMAAVSFNPRKIDESKAPVLPFSQPLVSVSFDDGWESVYTNAFPELQSQGIHTTQYIITDTFDDYSYMSLPQLHSIQNAGHEIGSHTVSHPDLTSLDAQQVTHELSDSRRTLQSEFGPVRDFTSPLGAYNAYTLGMIGKYYRSQKNAEGDPAANELESINVKKGFNPLNFKSYSMRKTTSLSDIQKLLKAAQAHNGWLVFTYHQVDDSGEEFSVSPAEFAKQLQLISDAPLRIVTIGQVFDALQPNWKASL